MTAAEPGTVTEPGTAAVPGTAQLPEAAWPEAAQREAIQRETAPPEAARPDAEPPVVRVVRAHDEAGMAQVHAIRHQVFVVEQRVPAGLEWDGKDARAVHVLAAGAGTGRLLVGADAAAKNGGDPRLAVLGRLAVLPAARRGGIGARLVRALEAEAARLGLRGVYLEAQVHAIGFYERLGYTAYGPPFTDAGIPHRAMSRTF